MSEYALRLHVGQVLGRNGRLLKLLGFFNALHHCEPELLVPLARRGRLLQCVVLDDARLLLEYLDAGGRDALVRFGLVGLLA
jgi:hypothetical protein